MKNLNNYLKMTFRSKLRCVKVRIILLLILVVHVLFTFFITHVYFFVKPEAKPTEKIQLDYIVVHIDLKGAPPTLEYLDSLLPMLKKYGVNGLLMEYEDMFPYEGSLRALSKPNCYQKKELDSYLRAAVSHGMEIIPLVQTFGHLEFALKNHDFTHLREIPEYPDSICPSSVVSKIFIEKMLRQIIQFHKKIAPLRYIHVGCDEVYRLNKCHSCRLRNLTGAQLLTSHVNFVVKTVLDLSPTTSVLIWDDMYRAINPIDCTKIIFRNTEAVFWDYRMNSKITENVHISMYKYGRMFDNLWIATAFKGADNREGMIPVLKDRFSNNLYWIDFIHYYGTVKGLYKFKGLIITGWSRYDHFAPLCELLPVSIPSLVLNLILIQKYKKGIYIKDMNQTNKYFHEHMKESFESALGCQNDKNRSLDLFHTRDCTYDESDLYNTLLRLKKTSSTAYAITDEYAYKYFLLKNNSSFDDEYEYFNNAQNHWKTLSKAYFELEAIERDLTKLLSAYYKNDVIIEFIKTKIRVVQKNMEGLYVWWKSKGMIKGINTSGNTRYQYMKVTSKCFHRSDEFINKVIKKKLKYYTCGQMILLVGCIFSIQHEENQVHLKYNV